MNVLSFMQFFLRGIRITGRLHKFVIGIRSEIVLVGGLGWLVER